MGQGRTMQEAMDEVKMVVEGVYSAKAAAKLGKKYQVSLPIIEEVNKVLFEDKSPKEAVNELMLRVGKAEHMIFNNLSSLLFFKDPHVLLHTF